MGESTKGLITCLERELFNALGRPGEAGDALEILKAINNIFGYFLVIMNCEREICSADPPKGLKTVAMSFRGLTQWIIEFANTFRIDWAKNVEGIKEGSKQFNITAKFTSPPQLERAMKKIEKFRERH
jgi:hypothetical protein